MSHPVHPRLPRGEAFRFTPFITDECSVTEWVTPGLPRMLPVVQDDSLCMPIITWNSLTPPPPTPNNISPPTGSDSRPLSNT